ncbi:MAG: allantoinase AllB [Gemmatimonadaceae bacterium]
MLGGNGLTVIRSRRVITPAGMRAASIHIGGERITRVAAWDDVPSGVQVHDAGESIVMPGVIDTHVHVNEPGRTEWEGFETATSAAAAGGVTTILDMPLNSIPATVNAAALDAKRDAARGKSHVNVEFIGGVVPGNAADLEPLAAAGVRVFKCFLSPSGVDEFSHVSEADLEKVFPVLAEIGLPLMVHAEDPAILTAAPDSHRYADYLASRPRDAERSAIEMLIRLMHRWPAPVHIVHLSSANSLDVVRDARAQGLTLTVETCPHYLTFAAEEIPDGATEYKCAPPIREAAEREALWAAIDAGEIDLVASDHSPCTPSMKDTGGNFATAWGGISSLQLSLAAVWTGARKRGFGPERIADWMCTGPARLAGLSGQTGALIAGYNADIMIWDPDETAAEARSLSRHRHHLTPYSTVDLYGRVVATYVRGQKWENSQI